MATAADDLLHRLDDEPASAELRVQAARALALESRHGEAHGVLRPTFENLVAHDAGPAASAGIGAAAFPCLCKRCIEPELGSITIGGLDLTRDFVVSRGRVLFFWVPEGLRGEVEGVRAAVHKELDARLAKNKWVSSASNPSDLDDDDEDGDGDGDDDDEDDDD